MNNETNTTVNSTTAAAVNGETAVENTTGGVTTETSAAEEEIGQSESVVEDKVEKQVYDYFPFKEDAWAWMNTPIANADAPIYYVHYDLCLKLARKMERQLELWEAQYLVQLDGPLVKCIATQVMFQPLKIFCGGIPDDIKQQLASGKFLSASDPTKQINLSFAGCFYLSSKHMLWPLSGRLYSYHQTHGYQLDSRSPFGFMALKIDRAGWRRKFGDYLEVAQQNQTIRKQRSQMRNTVGQLAGDVISQFERRAKSAQRN